MVDFVCHKEWVDECEVRVGEVAVVPHLLGHQQGAEHKRAPVGGLQGQVCESNQAVDVDKANYAALRPKVTYVTYENWAQS